MSLVRSQYESILKLFPTAVSPCRRYREMYWLVKVADITMSMKFFCPEFPSANNIKIYGDQDILSLVESNLVEYRDQCSGSTTVLQYMIQFNNFLKAVEGKLRAADSSVEPMKESDIQRNIAVLSQVEEVGFQRVTDIGEQLDKVQFSYKDGINKLHKLDLLIPEDYPSSDPNPLSCLPPSVWTPTKSKSFMEIYNSWKGAVEQLVPTWSALTELDRVCWVLDPDPPTPAHLYRRLAVAPSVSIQIEVDPLYPNQLPSVKFFGPESKISPLRSKLCSNSEDWDPEEPLLNNLERILDLEFPSQISINREELKVDCWICYSYNLDGSTPSVICKTDRCSACFHASCIYEWLKSLPDPRTTLQTLFGKCPYCKSLLSVQIPK